MSTARATELHRPCAHGKPPLTAGRVTLCPDPFCFPAQTLGPQKAVSKKQGKTWVLSGKVNAFKTREWSE